MDSVEIQGADYAVFARAVYRGRGRVRSDLRDCREWVQPIGFFPRSRILRQLMPGPCGLFPILQAHLVEPLKLTPSGDPFQLLHSAVLDVFTRISRHFVFCIECDPQAQKCTFRATDDRGAAFALSQPIRSFKSCFQPPWSVNLAYSQSLMTIGPSHFAIHVRGTLQRYFPAEAPGRSQKNRN
jgi:hypothetical protein